MIDLIMLLFLGPLRENFRVHLVPTLKSLHIIDPFTGNLAILLVCFDDLFCHGYGDVSLLNHC
jgi:hypothetical protein